MFEVQVERVSRRYALMSASPSLPRPRLSARELSGLSVSFPLKLKNPAVVIQEQYIKYTSCDNQSAWQFDCSAAL